MNDNTFVAGQIYYQLGYLDPELTSPNIVTLIYLGDEGGFGGEGEWCFQDIESYYASRDGENTKEDMRGKVFIFDVDTIESVMLLDQLILKLNNK